MARTTTPVCEFDLPAPDFNLLGTDGKYYSLKDCSGPKGTLVLFICNHCPYVKAVLPRLIEDAKTLQQLGIGVVAINSNDTEAYPEDNYENMQALAQQTHLPFPFLLDETQDVARAYNAVCTPDVFGYNANLKLQYRGRIDSSGKDATTPGTRRDMVEAMKQVAQTGRGPQDQISSIGCSIKWK